MCSQKIMESIYKEYNHNPSHLFSPNSKYFITGATYKKKMWFKNNKAKEQLLKSIIIGFDKHGWLLEDWVILKNHYHLLGNAPDDSSNLPEMMQEIHKFVALWIKKNIPESRNAEKIMYNYWDTCITFEASYFARLNYIWNNPVKHGYTNNAEEWIFGSYFKKAEKDKEALYKIMKKYPCDTVKIKDDF